MAATRCALPGSEAVACAALRPARKSGLPVALAGVLAAFLGAPTAVGAQAPDADPLDSATSPTAGVRRRPASPAADQRAKVGAPSPGLPSSDGAVLVAAGEPVQNIDEIIEALDRQAPVSAVAFSPDGGLIVSGSDDRMVRVWHLTTGRLLRRLEGHSSAVTAVAFSPDGGAIASASNDRTVRLWDARSGRLLRTLQGHVYHVYAVAFDPGGRWLATASWDRTIQLWDVRSGVLAKKLRGHGAAVRAIDFSPNGKLLASGSDDQAVRLWSVESGKELKVFAGHKGPVNAVRFGPDGKWLFSGGVDHTARMWRLLDGAVVRKLGDCGAPVLSLAVSANGQLLGGACGAGGSVLWDVATSTELRRRGGHATEARAIAFSPDGRLVATGSEDASITVEDVATGRALVSLSANLAHLSAAQWSPDGSMLATASRDGRILIWQDEGDHKILGRVLVGDAAPLRALAFSPDGKALAMGGQDRKVAIWELGTGGGPHRLVGHEGAVNAVAFAPDGRSIASASDDATVRLWDLKKDGGEARVMKGHRAPVRAVAVSPDGRMLASASDDETVRIWDAATGRHLAVLSAHRGPVHSVVFSSDGKYLVTGSRDRTIDVWLPARGKLLKGMRKELPSGVVAVAARGGRIAAASSDGILSLWELAGSRPRKQSTAHADAPSALAIAPDGATIASASRDGVLRIWDAETLERRWSLAGSTRERWFACNNAGMCWRNEEGTLLGRVNGQGDRVPVSPSDDAHRTALRAVVDREKLDGGIVVVEGRTVSIPLRIENRGRHPAYWVNVAQSVMRTAASRVSLVLIPPPTIRVLPPGAGANVVCEVSALGEYENPRPHAEKLRLSITSSPAETLALEIPVEVDAPQVTLRGLTLVRSPGEAVVAAMTGVSMAQLEPVLLHGGLTLEGGQHPGIAAVAIEQPFIGQDLALAFPWPEGVRLDRHSRMTFTLRKSTHPVHVWTFAHTPVRLPIPLWSWALLGGGLLGLGLVVWRARSYTRPLGRLGKRSARLAVAALLGVGQALKALVCFPSTVRSWRARLERRGIAVTFFRLQPETQCSHLARQLGASWAPLAGAQPCLFELQLGGEVPLNLGRCLLALPAGGDALGAALAELDAADEGPDGITVVLSEVPRSELAEHLRSPRRLVVFSKSAMNRVLRAPRPGLAFAQVVSDQVDRTAVSLYRAAFGSGQRQPFHGRKGELRRLLDPRGNYLVIGPDGIGKTRLLDELRRRLRARPTVECHYVSLADGDLTSALADELEMPGETLLEVLLERLIDRPPGHKVVVLCDDADAWATLDAAQGGAQLQTLALLNQEHPCSFVLAGFLGLLHAARPARGRKPFGAVVRLESLEVESGAELATLPMAALNLHYAHAGLVELIVRQSGAMPSLLVAICDQIVDRLPPDQRTVDRTLVESACKSDLVARAITTWRPRFGLQEPRLATLDQTVMLSAVFKTRFTLPELQSTLAGLGVPATAAEIEHSANRLVAACVFEHWLGHYHFRVPLFQTVMQEATLARMIAR